ncbi:MAG: radical SAM protein [Bacillota bacterium]
MRTFKTLLIALYNYKGLGVRYLSSVLKQHGYPCSILFLKGFQAHNMRKPSEVEYALVNQVVEQEKPDLIGISYMCTFHREVIEELTRRLRAQGHRVVWGGVCTTLFPEQALEHVDTAVLGEAEEAVVDLVRALEEGRDCTGIPNLAFRQGDGIRINELRPLIRNLDALPHPDLGGDDKYYINDDRLVCGDPELNSLGYEVMASRGCPFRCSFCANQNLKQIYAGKGPYLRYRSVENVIAEIEAARRRMPRLRMIHFWDEIFPDKEEWVRKFAALYKERVNLPFEVWHHPLKVRPAVIRPLVEAGLSKVVVGIQSGSPYIRNKVFLRPESQEEIINCSRVLSEARVPTVIYDLILDHPFEKEEHLAETLDLCLKLHHPFYLQLHGLSFLPGTAIEQMALEQGLVSPEAMRRLHLRPLEEQYRAMYWWFHGTGTNQDRRMVYWNTLIYFTQIRWLVPFVRWARHREVFRRNPALLQQLQKATNLALIGKKAARKLKIALGARA